MSNELYHHGVQGMKWGVRRYQNKNGSLTLAGKLRYGVKRVKEGVKEADYEGAKTKVDNMHKVVDEAGKILPKRPSQNKVPNSEVTRLRSNLSEMSDEELRRRINRMNMEENYMNVMKNRYKETEAGKIYLHDILDVAGVTLTTASSALALAIAIKELRK